MEDLSDLVWKSAGVAKPSSSSSTPLNHLSNPSSKSQSPLNNTLRPNLSSSPQTQQSYNPNSNTFTAPRNASPMANYSIPQSAFQQSSPSQVPLNQNSFTSTSTPSKMQSTVSSMANSNVSAGKKDDLFGNLVSFGGNSSPGKQNLANMSLAEQVKLKQQQQQQSQNRVNSVSAADQLFLDSLGGSGGGGVTSQFQQSQPRPTTPQGRINQSSPMTHSPQTPPFSSLSSSNKVSPAQSPGSPHQFKLHQSTANVTQQQTTASSAAAWDFDLLAGNNNTSQISTLSTNVTKQPSVAAANIDQSFATFGTPVASSQNQKAEMDLLGDFKSPPSISQPALTSKPSSIPTKPATANPNDPFGFLPESVKTTPPQPQLPQTPKSTVPPNTMAQSSPPNGTASNDNVDHLVAKMMDMGFDSESSLKALRSTNGNLQSAVDMLVNGKVTPKGAPVDSPRERKYSDTNDDDDSDLYRQKQKYYEGGSPTSGRRYGNDDKSGSAQQKLSQLGTSVFSKASSVLSKAKEKVASKVEEVKEAGGAAAVLSNVVGVVQSKVDTFKGSPARGKESEDAFAKYSGGYSDYSDTFQDKPTYNGFSNFKETSHPSTNDFTSSVPQPQPAPSPPKPKISRPPFIPIESAILDLVKSAKNSGNESYKLGQFADAVTHYSTAINYLPPNHVMLIQLYNNRAAAKLKTGEYKTCIADCDLVQTIIAYYGGLSVSSSGEDDSDTKIVDSSTETSITISDLVKSLVRKGTALEAIEKYNDAKEVYREVLLKFESKNKLANEGVSRCSKALAPSNPAPSVPQPSSSSSQPAPSNSNPKDELLSMFDTTNSFSGSSGIGSGIASQLPPEKQSTVDVNASKAVQEIRAQEKANEIEAEEKLRLKDYIDAKILAWKAGKEANLRALLSSLETVLWEELKWTKTNLSELITPNQVKVRYMKAIAKIHPDKIPSTETTEHKLIANAVFSILNDAWDSFKAQN
ncbi:hypothetical protein BKA69DRAFT_1078404, partial [Paraphysoderma sedebokerense]